jgi:hypothetical protein
MRASFVNTADPFAEVAVLDADWCVCVCVCVCFLEREGQRRGRRLVTMSGPDALFPVRNNFYLGAFQRAINGSHGTKLSDAETVEKDCTVYRSYIALGQYQV